MLKHSHSEKLEEIIVAILNLIINKNAKSSNYNNGTLKPIIKDEQKSWKDSNNIRPITISDWISNILESYLLECITETYQENQLQFGFRKKYSCQHAIFIMKESILYHKKIKKHVYVIFMDFSKAFDKIVRSRLFYKLIGKIEDNIWLALYNYYDNSTINITNNGELSRRIKTTIGVKQGGPLSPKLFSIYIDELIVKISDSKLSLILWDQTVGTLFYADDSAVSCTSITKLQQSTNIIIEYCIKHKIKINIDKTKWMKFGPKNGNEKITIDNEEIERVDKFKYLGYWIKDNLLNEEHINKRIENATKRYYSLNTLGLSNKNMKSNIKSYLIKSQCRTILNYGIENTSLTKTEINKINKAENNIIRKSLNLHKLCHMSDIRKALYINDTKINITLAKLRFFIQLYENSTTNIFLQNQINNLRNNYLKRKTFINDIIEELRLNIREVEITELLRIVYIKRKRIEDEIKNSFKEDRVSNIRHLLNNRNKENDELLNILTRPNAIYSNEAG